MSDRLSSSEIKDIARQAGVFELSDAEAEQYRLMSDVVLGVIDTVDRSVLTSTGLDPDRSAPADRDAGRKATSDEDPYNAIVRWCRVTPTSSGALDGMRIAVKDSVAVAGVPITLGSRAVKDFVPRRDSIVARRLLEAGAEIVAVANMDDFAFSGGGDTSAQGHILNPVDPTRSAGGSSGGPAAALYYSDVIDGAIGCDQGGSIRLPAGWCGVLGLKPTHGLVPYSGIAGIDITFDHVGPMACDATSLGRLLDTIAGQHPGDPRQYKTPPWEPGKLTRTLEDAPADLRGVRIGLLTEGYFSDTAVQEATSRAVRDAAQRMAEAGADVVEVSVPTHLEGGGVAFAGFIEGMAATLYGGGNGFHWEGDYWPELSIELSRAMRENGEELAPQIKLVVILGAYLQHKYGGAVYAAAQNERPRLAAGYDAALRDLDCLMLPTAPFPAYEHIAELGLADRVLRGWDALGNCSLSDMTGHPGLSMPACSVDGLPAGAMLIGHRWGDARLVEIAQRYERALGWDAVGIAAQGAVHGPTKHPLN